MCARFSDSTGSCAVNLETCERSRSPSRKYVWSRKPSVVEPLGFGRRADAREVDVRRDVLLAGRRSHGGARAPDSGPAIVCRANVVSVPPACVSRVQLARVVAVVDEDDEAAPQPPRRVADPVDARAG